jgi:hypothetical protein
LVGSKTAQKEIDSSKVVKNITIIPFGNLEKPKQETLLFKNATVWTNEKEGILQQTDVLIKMVKLQELETAYLRRLLSLMLKENI